jgi:hypothetical protein
LPPFLPSESEEGHHGFYGLMFLFEDPRVRPHAHGHCH